MACYRCGQDKPTVEQIGKHPPLCDDCWSWWRFDTDLTGINPYWRLFYKEQTMEREQDPYPAPGAYRITVETMRDGKHYVATRDTVGLSKSNVETRLRVLKTEASFAVSDLLVKMDED